MTTICAVLGIARRSAYYVGRARADGRQHRATDDTVLQQIRAVTNSRATYGYRRVWAMVNRTFRAGYNRKRIRRVMQLHGLMLAPRVHRRHGRPHLGQIQQAASNRRWCSDVFLIPCWSGEVLSVAFAIDCHDREVPACVASPRSFTGADIRTLMNKAQWRASGRSPRRPRTRFSGSRARKSIPSDRAGVHHASQRRPGPSRECSVRLSRGAPAFAGCR